MRVVYNEDVSMKKVFEKILIVLCIIGVLLTILSWIL